MALVKPKLKELPPWQKVMDEKYPDRDSLKLDLVYYDKPEEDVVSPITKEGYLRRDKQHIRYKWFDSVDTNTNLVNLYFPNNYYTERKRYGVVDAIYYLRYRELGELARSIMVSFIPEPYSEEYNDTIVIYSSKDDSFNYMSIYHVDIYNDIIISLLIVEGFVCMYDYVVYSLYNDYWLVFSVDTSIFMVNIIYKGDDIVGVYIYVVDRSL